MPISILPESLPVSPDDLAKSRQVVARITELAQLMGLGSWEIKIDWHSVEGTFTMETTAEPEYYKVTISIDLPKLEYEDIDAYLRHELLHAILWQYTETAEALALKKAKSTIRKLEERTVSDLERMPLWDKLSSDSA